MPLRYSQIPGKRERHLIRKQDNPLFPEAERTLTESMLEEAQRLDHEELVSFITDFRALVHEAVKLPTNAESELILSIKERLDQAYEQASRMVDDQQETKEAIGKLVTVIMHAVKKGAGSDKVALQELADEEAARAAHYALLAYPLVADMLDPDSAISSIDLAPTLLSSTPGELQAACSLFDEAQLAALAEAGKQLLDQTPDAPEEAHSRLQEMIRHRSN
jgi:hypothetical protein